MKSYHKSATHKKAIVTTFYNLILITLLYRNFIFNRITTFHSTFTQVVMLINHKILWICRWVRARAVLSMYVTLRLPRVQIVLELSKSLSNILEFVLIKFQTRDTLTLRLVITYKKISQLRYHSKFTQLIVFVNKNSATW
jgi:hypothetical protein